MATAQQVINDAAGIAGLLPAGQALNSAINATALDKLNDMIAAWESEGIYLGLPTLVAADDVLVEAADLRAIKLNLSVELMMHYGRAIRADVMQQSRLGKIDLRAKYYNPVTLTVPVELRVATAENILTGQ
jgi:3D (Asp-Asp-Asp) domain-containing protein